MKLCCVRLVILDSNGNKIKPRTLSSTHAEVLLKKIWAANGTRDEISTRLVLHRGNQSQLSLKIRMRANVLIKKLESDPSFITYQI